MSTRRVLSSREPINDARLNSLFEILFLLDDVLGKPHQDYAVEESTLMDSIGERVVEVALKNEDLIDETIRLGAENLNLTIANAMLESAVEKRQKALETLASPPAGFQAETDEAVKFFMGVPGVKSSMDPNSYSLQYTMDADTLKRAIEGAIEMYVLEHLSNMKL